MRRFGVLSLALTLLSSGLALVSAPSALATYAFTSHTFTSCGTSGPTGPLLATCRSSYATTWDESNSNFTTVNGIQYWVVPFSGRYYIDAYGAGGGGLLGGGGARIADTFELTAGETIRILVGQTPATTAANANAGGGGTYVVRTPFNSNGSILVVAGAGGGTESGSTQNANAHGSTSTSGNSGTGVVGPTNSGAGGTAGSGGGTASSDNGGGGGGGFLTNGTRNTNWDNNGGTAFVNGGNGATAGTGSVNAIAGGFGGGGGAGGRGAGGGAGAGGGYSGGGGSDNASGASGGGGGSYFANGLNVNRIFTTDANPEKTNGYVTITSLGPSLTTFAPLTTLTNQASIVYDITFSQTVTGLAAADFSRSGTGSSTCTVGTPSGSDSTYTVTLSGCSPGTVILTMLANAVSVSSQSGPAADTAAATVTIDQTLPTISGTLTGPANATYIPGQSLTFTAPFSETVTVTGTPRLALTIGSTTRYANYLSGTNTRTLTFTYVVQTALADIDTDGISLATSLELNSGSIQDLATNTLSNFTFTAPTLTSVLVAQRPAAPTITSISPSSGTLSVAFTSGATNGSVITNYEFSTNNGVNWTTRNPVATTSPLIITGLNNGQAYNVRLRAINGAGFGDSSTAVAATPSAVVVIGDATLASTYGQVASTGTYSASGGTGGYTFSLSDTPTGVTINPSNGTVTTATTTPAGTYTQSVRATDSSSQVGTRALTITVNKAATSITIALPNSATSAALGGAVTITATVPRAGAVNFRLAGATLAGCGAAAAASTTATCSWTPLALGSVALTAIFTPTDTANFETSTTTTLTITVVNGVSTVSLSLTGGVTQVPKGQAINIIAAIDQVGRITFLIDGKRIPGCFNLVASVIGNKSCSWKPAVQKAVNISARLTPTNNVYNASSSNMNVQVVRRSGAR